MSDMRESATETIIKAMELADDMGEVVVIYRLKDNNGGDQDGFAWVSNTDDTFVRVGMIESAKWGMLQKSYTEGD